MEGEMEVEAESIADDGAVAEADNVTQEEADRIEAQRALALWAEHCELNQGQEVYEANEGDFDYEAMSDGDDDYEVERYINAGDEDDEKPIESNRQ